MIRRIVEICSTSLGNRAHAAPDLAGFLERRAESEHAEWARRELAFIKAEIRDQGCGVGHPHMSIGAVGWEPPAPRRLQMLAEDREVQLAQQDLQSSLLIAPRLSKRAMASGYGDTRDTGPFAMSTVVCPNLLTTMTSPPISTR